MSFSDGRNNYEIANINLLESSAANLSIYNRKLTDYAENLKSILNSIRQNWENENGQDIQSITKSIDESIKALTGSIQPVITNYVKTLNLIVSETRATQNRRY